MDTRPQRLRERRLPRGFRSRRQRAAAATLVSAVAIGAALVLVLGAVLGPARAGTAPLLAGFEARSYRPGQVATLSIGGAIMPSGRSSSKYQGLWSPTAAA